MIVKVTGAQNAEKIRTDTAYYFAASWFFRSGSVYAVLIDQHGSVFWKEASAIKFVHSPQLAMLEQFLNAKAGGALIGMEDDT
jgi:hypothetical protein